MDFPELVETPAETYAQTLIQRGIPVEEVGMHLLAMDIQVKLIRDSMLDTSTLGFAAPETITADRVLDKLGWHNLTEEQGIHSKELLACVSKAVGVLRGDIKPNVIWPKADEEDLTGK